MKTGLPNPFLSIEHATVRHLDRTLFAGLSFRMLKGEQWAVTGPSGSGKTSLLNAIAGRHNVINGSIRYHFYEELIRRHPATDPLFSYRDLITLVSHHHHFLNRSNTTDFYYQQRFNAWDAMDAPKVKDYLSEIAAAGNRHPAGHHEVFSVEKIAGWLRLDALTDRELIKLSNGETRRLMIAEALLKQPCLLMLDSPFMGLDAQTRPAFSRMIDEITAAGVTVLMVTTPEEIPESITHVAELEKGQMITYDRTEFLKKRLLRPQKEEQKRKIDSERLKTLYDRSLPSPEDFTTVVRMENVNVQYDRLPVLKNISWTVAKGEKWALLGPNGAGKSTLLSLINGDNPQAYANHIFLFDRRRGSGESIWEIKQRIGFVSPELHQYFTARDSCLEIVLSGFFDTIGLYRKYSAEQQSLALSWLELLHLDPLKDALFSTLPAGKQRLVLLLRALVKNPPLLILDEPCQGLDEAQKAEFKFVVEEICGRKDKTLIYVTHYTEEIPACVTKILRLNAGEIIPS